MLKNIHLRPIGFYRRTRDSIKKKIPQVRAMFANWKYTNTEKIKYLKELIGIHLVYGLLLDFTLHVLFGLPLKISWVFALSFTAYIIKVELPYVVRSSR